MRIPVLVLFLALGCAGAAPAATGPTADAPSTPRAALLEMAEEFVRQQAGNYPGSVEVSIEAPAKLEGAPCAQPQAFLPSGQRLRPRLSVALRCLAPVAWTGHLQATLSINGFFYVASHDLEPGHVISLGDLIPREADILSLGRGVVVDPSQLLNHIVTQRVPSGTALKSRTVRSPYSVQRGQTVKIEARGSGFTASSEGRSLQDGVPGEQIRIRTASGRVISATVVNASTVQVAL